MAETSATLRCSLRQRERELEARASLIDTHTDINFREAARIIARAAGYLRFFVWRSAIKLALTWMGRALPIFVLTWFGKILIDHVVLGKPIEEAEQYPAYMEPVLAMLHGYNAFEIMIFLAAVGVGLMLLIGAYPGYRDEVEAGLAEGRDYATQTENAMHGGHSSLGALYGYVEFIMNMRLTQALNHTLRGHVFSRISALSMTRLEDQRISDDSKESFKRFRFQQLAWMAIFWVNGAFNQAIELFFFCYVLLMVIDGQLSVGDFGVLLGMIGQLRGRAQELAWIWIRFQDNVAAMRRVFAMMDLPPEDDLGGTRLPPIRQGVRMRNAGLVFPDGRRALAGIDLDARVAQIVAFVGPTGAGKTSLAYLIPRFHLATEGEVRIDEHPVNDLTLDSLRSQVTYVFQETQLFSDSILDNIRYGKPQAEPAEVERVAKIAGIHDFIVSLPQGYRTRLGTVTSSKLSVGRKQRIAIAPGLLRDSKILILDEPTSALDPETEEYLVRSLHEAAKDRLVIIIAHRLSTIAKADTIVFLDDGRIAEQGSHAQLMARADGHYRRFVSLQTQAAA